MNAKSRINYAMRAVNVSFRPLLSSKLRAIRMISSTQNSSWVRHVGHMIIMRTSVPLFECTSTKRRLDCISHSAYTINDSWLRHFRAPVDIRKKNVSTNSITKKGCYRSMYEKNRCFFHFLSLDRVQASIWRDRFFFYSSKVCVFTYRQSRLTLIFCSLRSKRYCCSIVQNLGHYLSIFITLTYRSFHEYSNK